MPKDGCISAKNARNRWQLLRNVLLERVLPTDDAASGRRIPTYGLWTADAEENSPWVKYRCDKEYAERSNLDGRWELRIQFVNRVSNLSPDNLVGFNNTGNVCIWPSEEILSFYCFKHPEVFQGASLIELGGGMTCFAGLVAAKCCSPRRVVLTDGNPTSVANVRSIVNCNTFTLTSVEVHELRWDIVKTWEAFRGSFDRVVCSDCLFFDTGREELVHCIYELLNPSGKALIVAPRRGLTLEKFVELAERKFFVSIEMDYDDDVSERKEALASDAKFDADLHYPLLVMLSKK